MSGLRFKVGDLVRVVVACGPHSQLHLGGVVEITRLWQVDETGRPVDYATTCDCIPDQSGCALRDWQLQPINPPAEPASLTRSEECGVEA